jgi:NAD(P)H-dependent FMN reductase
MKLLIFNGSPRYKKSNSKILIEHFLNGYNKIYPEPVPVHYMANRKQKDEQLEIFHNSEIVIIVFPLYTDCMPGIVKEFFESILELNLTSPKKIGFVVQSGFPEAIHSIYIERYLDKFTKRIQCEYMGTIIKGGVEGIQIMPSSMTKKLFGRFESLGEYLAKNEEFSPEINKLLRKPFKMSPARIFLFRLISKTGLTNFYWDSNLKKNNAYINRFDKPFEEENNSTRHFV